MGIDVYMSWKGQTEEEKEKQYTGFSVVHGHVGYLREAYHGDPYATRFLVREAFESKTATAQISADVLESRLQETIEIVKRRYKKIYNEEIDYNHPAIQSFVDFVELARRKEDETSEPVTIIVSY